VLGQILFAVPYFDYTTWGGCLYSGFCFFTAR